MGCSKNKGGGRCKQELNFLGLLDSYLALASCLFSFTHTWAKKVPDKAFWTSKSQGAPDELKPRLSGTDILPVLMIMEVTL